MIDLGDPLPIQAIEVRDSAGALANSGIMTLTVTLPDGTTASPGFTNAVTGRYVPGAYLTVQSGTHRARWVGTGVNAAAFEEAFYVYPVASAVPWRPLRPAVAKYIAERTIPADQTSDVPLNMFTAATNPTDAQADEHIAAAVGWVAARTGTVAPSLTEQATETAAIRAAGMIELSYPVRQNDINTAQALLAQAATMLTALVDANEQISVDSGAPGLLSEYAFPEPVNWGDTLLW
jgi:hypothetical protein